MNVAPAAARRGPKTDSSCCGSVILVDETSEDIASSDGARNDRYLVTLVCHGGGQPKCPVWPSAVVVLRVGPKHMIEVAASEDQGPVQALGSDRANPALGEGVGIRGLDRGEDHP